MVLVTNGQGGIPNTEAYKTAFNYLLKCLAARGFVAVAVKSSTSAAVRVGQVKESIVPALKAAAERGISQQVLSNLPLALIGHSEACYSMAQVANDLRTGTGIPSGVPYSNVAAVVALAPGYNSGFMHPNYTDSLLVLGSTHDEQTGGRNAVNFYQYYSGVSDFACLFMFWGLEHFDFWDKNAVPGGGPPAIQDIPPMPSRAITRPASNFAIAELVTLFLAWRLADEDWSPIFRDGYQIAMSSGDPLIDSELKEQVQIFWQYFEKGNQVLGACGGAECVYFLHVQDANDLYNPTQTPKALSHHWPFFCQASTRGYRLKFHKQPNWYPSVWVYPAAEKLKGRDCVEFDVAQTVYGSAPTDKDIYFDVQINIGYYGKIAVSPLYKVRRCIDVHKTGVGSFGLSLPHTYKIPFSDLGLTSDDLANISSIVINFSVPQGTSPADLLMSEVRFSS